MKQFVRSLYGKISIVFLGLLSISGFIQILLSVNSSLDFVQESDQKVNLTLARDLAEKFLPFLEDSLDLPGIEHTIHELMVMNPRVEIYLLDETGKILAFFADPAKVKAETVALEPITSFLASSDNLPIWAEDPRNPGVTKPFSVAPIQIGGDVNGYLFVILGGEQYDSALAMVRGSYIARTTAINLLITIAFTAIIGMVLFGLLTKRFRRMTEGVEKFRHGNFDQRIEIESRDEIGLLANAFNSMADTIAANVDELKRNDQLRRDLVANVSHDLRSPLASMQGYMETIVMKENELKPEQRKKYMRIIYENSLKLSTLVSELFELSKLDAKQVQPKEEPFSMSELTQDVVMKFKPKADKLKVNLQAALPKNFPTVQADIGLIERALSNLIDNALQYTPQDGTVRVDLENKQNRVRVLVSDTGSGIPKEDIPMIFERFYRVEKSRGDIGGGSGLGLAIAKRILDLHESAISVDSVVDRGTTMSFDLKTST